MQTEEFTAYGRVQGVGFRYTTRQLAQELGVTGWVANQADGTVNGVAQAAPDVLAEFFARLADGLHPFMRVDQLNHAVVPAPARTYQHFQIR